MEMKKILTALILTTVIAAPAFARTTTEPEAAPDWQTSPYSVYNEGIYRGTDPDPQIRFELRRESPHGG
jgi:hypothetical protein